MASPGTRFRPHWLLRQPALDAQALIFCLPYAGGGASMFHRWPRRIGGAEVCPVQLPGRENRMREPFFVTYQQIAEQLADGLLEFLDRPFGFFGHCGSALIGLETAALLAERGAPTPRRVFVSSMVSPDRTTFPSVLHLDDGGLMDLITELARARGVEILPEMAELGLPVMRADVEVYRRYEPGPPGRFTCPVTVLSWAADDLIPPAETGGWEPYGAVRSSVLPGGHWSFLDAPEPLLHELLADLTTVESAGPGP